MPPPLSVSLAKRVRLWWHHSGVGIAVVACWCGRHPQEPQAEHPYRQCNPPSSTSKSEHASPPEGRDRTSLTAPTRACVSEPEREPRPVLIGTRCSRPVARSLESPRHSRGRKRTARYRPHSLTQQSGSEPSALFCEKIDLEQRTDRNSKTSLPSLTFGPYSGQLCRSCLCSGLPIRSQRVGVVAMEPEQGSISRMIGLLKSGDRDAACQLWGRYFQRLVELARVHLRSMPRRAIDEEDVAVSVFDSFFRRAEGGQFPRLNDRDDLWQLLFVSDGSQGGELGAPRDPPAPRRGQGLRPLRTRRVGCR